MEDKPFSGNLEICYTGWYVFRPPILQWACQTDTTVSPPKEAVPDVAAIAFLPLLVEAQALSASPAYQNVVGLASPVDRPTIILDTRAESAYLEGHIPGAISLNVDPHMEQSSLPHPHLRDGTVVRSSRPLSRTQHRHLRRRKL